MTAIFRALAPFVNFALKLAAGILGIKWIESEFTPKEAEESPTVSIAAVMGLVFGILFVTQAFSGKGLRISDSGKGGGGKGKKK
jgi:hypothetical protein